MLDKELLKLVPVNEDEKLNAMLRDHQKQTGLDYCDDTEIISHTFQVMIANDKASDEVDSIIERVRLT